MKIALMHFHLNTGGVTAVIRQQAALLAGAGHEVLLLCGQTPRQKMPAPVAVVAGLGYDPPYAEPPAADRSATAILEVLRDRWPGGGPDLIHAHNPTLAKNRRMQAILKQLQQAGVRLLCQVHDFAEDGRPEVFFSESYVADCHYAVVNDRDRQLLERAGLDRRGVHYLPNAINALAPGPATCADARGPVLYPVRAIRRKNIGEAILLHEFMDNRAPLNITLPPSSPQDMPVYEAWKAFASRHGLDVAFEAGLRADFNTLVAACRFALTTSITEGFGFSFLEPWTAGKALWGRLLPDICRDFTRKGLCLDHLYTRLWIPLAWLDTQQLFKKWRLAMVDTARRFNHRLPEERIDTGWQAVTTDNRIDFGLLDEAFQQTAILQVLTQAGGRQTLQSLNGFLQSPGPPQDCAALIAHNQDIVRRRFSPQQCLGRLLQIYARVMDDPVRHKIDKSILLDAFLRPERFSLLKWRLLHG